MLAAERSDPEVVGRDGLAFFLQFEADNRIGMSRLVVYSQDRDRRAPLAQPGLIACSVTRLCDAKAIFAKYDHRYGQAFSTGDDIHRVWIVLGSGRQSVGV